MQALRGAPARIDSIVTGGLVALPIALLFHPLVDVVRRQVRRLLFRGKFDPAQVVQEVGMRVRDSIGLNELSSALVNSVRSLWDVERVAFFVVHPLAESEGSYWLERMDVGAPAEGAGRALGTDSPVAQYLESQLHPLTREEIERAPQFVGMEAGEHEWFLKHELYVPIHAHGEWIGLLGVGDKSSQGAYLEEDLWLLRRLAERTGPVLWHLLGNRALEGAQTELKRAYLALEGRLDQLQKTYDSLETEQRRLAEQDAAKTRFLEAIDEPLRAPFVNLDFALQLMEHYGLEGWTRDQRDQLEQLRAEVHKAKRMAENLIALAGLLRGEDQMAKEELDLEPVIRAVLQPLRTQAESKGVHLAVEVGTPLPLVYGDRHQLGDAVFQMAQQALQFTEAAGSIWVHCWGEDDTLHVEVQDTGTGALAEGTNGLWERRRVERGTARPSGSLKLELALVQSIVGAHGGRVYAKSEPRVGNTFGFQIPAQKG
jgi:signal transduction histidine kinase